MIESETKFETVVQEFGNGAHVTIPKEWLNDIVQIERVSPLCPDLFQDAQEGAEVIIEISNGETISGEVTDFDVEVQDERNSMWSQIIVSTGPDENDAYSVTTRRDAGDDGWENEYNIERKIPSEEMGETDEIIALNGDGMWVEEGTVESLAVKQSAPAQ